ncbi:MAG: RHS repeat-associated core domain-containing protein, partial [Planctomycetota bacterium]
NKVSSSGSGGDRFGFTGREFDAALNLYYYRARFYDPATGRFMGKDPIGFDAGDRNLYRYVGNGPTNGTDPLGLADSVTLNFWRSLAAGKIDEAIALLATAQQTGHVLGNSNKGIKVVEGLVGKIFETFPAYSMKCNLAADKVSNVFKAVGEKPVIVRFRDKNLAPLFKLPDGRDFAVMGWHEVVRCNDRFYDALTGAAGMAWPEYEQMILKLGINPVPYLQDRDFREAKSLNSVRFISPDVS